MQQSFFRSLFLLILLNLLIKPVWIFGIDRQTQLLTGFEAYGTYFALLSLTLVLNFILDFGITVYFNQQHASGENESASFFKTILITKIGLTALYAAAIFFIAWMTRIENKKLLWMLALLQVLISFLLLIRARLTAAQQFTRDAVLSVTDKSIVIILAGTLILYPSLLGPITIDRFVWIQILGVLIAILAGSIPLMRIGGFSGIWEPAQAFREALLPGLPFAINIFFMTLLARGDSFVLERMHTQGAGEAGIYAASYRLLDALNMVGFLFTGFLMPFVARHFKGEEPMVQHTLLSCRHLLLLFSVLTAAFAVAAPGFINQLLYDHTDPYFEKVLSFSICCLPSMAIVHIYGTTLTATGHIWLFSKISLAFSFVSLLLNVLLSGIYGAVACAMIACGLQALYALAVFYTTWRKANVKVHLLSLAEYLLAAFACFGLIRLGLHLGWNIPLVVFSSVLIVMFLVIFRGRIALADVIRALTEK